jgi:hexosaminidase
MPTLKLPAAFVVIAPDKELWRRHLEIFGTHLSRLTAGKHRLIFETGETATLAIKRDEKLDSEAYAIDISDKQIQLSASSFKGLAHGTATLLQLIRSKDSNEIPQLSIRDQPGSPYRSFMVDMGRNPHSVQLLKETIDLLWFYKVNSLQLHLTDDQRTAFPSKAFPKLWDGLITMDQFRDLEDYAVARGITIIPELEVPGHSNLLRKHYPETFGKSATDIASNPKALAGIKTLLDEMMEIFSSPYIHIGGDEAFSVPEHLQRKLINQLHAYLKSKGRQTLVWEGPKAGEGDNKVNTEVIHLNWRTINYPADKMLKDGYRVVNAAWDPLYIVDHYPRTNFTMTSPQHIYETMSLTRFKHVNPGIPTFAEPIVVEPNTRLIGFCMPWWEGREKNYLPLNVPRLIPFAEVAWHPESKREFKEFAKRSAAIENVRINAFYPVAIETAALAIPQEGVFHDQTTVALEPRLAVMAPNTKIRWTRDGSEPTAESPEYRSPIKLTTSTHIRAAMFVDGEQLGPGSRKTFTAVTPEKNLALGKPVTSSTSSDSPFSVERITDGGTGNLDFYLGYPATPKPIAITIDLESIQTISRINVIAYSVSNSFEKYQVQVSTDGQEFLEVAARMEKPDQPTPKVQHRFDPREARYVRILSYGNRGYVFDSFSKIVEVQVHP